MTTSINSSTDSTVFFTPGPGALNKILAQNGRFPPVSLKIVPLDTTLKPVFIDRFLSYKFDSSVLVPVDTFEFIFANTDGPPFDTLVKEGDICILYANNQPIANGIIDVTTVAVDSSFGEKVTVQGRNLLSQLEDQDSVSTDAEQIFGQNLSVDGVMNILLNNTRISKTIVKNQAPKLPYLFMSEPGEKKLQSLHRYLEPLNCLVFMSPQGQLVIGRPQQYQTAKGSLVLSREKRFSNVTDMSAIRASTQIPNIILPIWSGQESVQARVGKQQAMYNLAKGPNRLRTLGHHVPRAVVVSNPDSNKPQEATELIVNAQQKAGSSNLLQAYGKREIARANQSELIVECAVTGHYNDDAEPFLIDTVYHVQFDRGNVDEDMYLYQVQYDLSEGGGQRTNLYLCRPNTIVSDIKAQ